MHGKKVCTWQLEVLTTLAVSIIGHAAVVLEVFGHHFADEEGVSAASGLGVDSLGGVQAQSILVPRHLFQT